MEDKKQFFEIYQKVKNDSLNKGKKQQEYFQ